MKKALLLVSTLTKRRCAIPKAGNTTLSEIMVKGTTSKMQEAVGDLITWSGRSFPEAEVVHCALDDVFSV